MRTLTTLPRALLASPEVVSGRALSAPLVLEADVVVVGSGAGGAMLAWQTSRAGLRTVVLEEGGNHTPAAVQPARRRPCCRGCFRTPAAAAPPMAP